MPRISIEDVIANVQDLPGRPLTVEPTKEQPAPGWLDIAAAAERQNNIAASIGQLFEPHFSGPRDPGYDPWNDIAGYEDHFDAFAGSRSAAETRQIKRRIDREKVDRDVLARAGWAGAAASIAAGMTDPLMLVAMALPVAPALAGASRGARVAAGVAASVGVDTVAEAAFHATQELRTAKDSIINVGAGALLTGVFGRLVTRIPKNEMDDAIRNLARELNEADAPSPARVAPEGSTAGAAAVGDATTLADEGIARGGRFIAATIGQASPLTRVLGRQSKAARQLVQRLADVPFLLEKHLKGQASPQSVESVIKRRQMKARFETIKTLTEQFKAYKGKGGTMRLAEFGEQVSKAMRRGDKHDIPEVAAVAARTREMFNADRAELQAIGALPEDFDILGAESYFPRVYDYDQIVANRSDLEQRLADWYAHNPHPKLKEDLDNAILEETQAATKADEARAAAEEQIEAVRKAKAERAVPARQLRTAKLRARQSRARLAKAERIAEQRAADRKAAEDRLAKALENERATAKDEKRANRKGGSALVEREARAASKEARQAEAAAERAKRRSERADHRAAQLRERVTLAESSLREADAAHAAARKALTAAARRAKKVKAKSAEMTRAAESAALAREKADEALNAFREPGEIDDMVARTINRILGTVRGNVDLGGATAPSVVKGRVLDLPYEIKKKWLIRDFETVMNRYIHNMVPQIEMRRAFGSTSLDEYLGESGLIMQEAEVAIARASSNRAKEKIRQAASRDIEALKGLRDRMLGEVGARGTKHVNLIRAARIARSYNYGRLLGGQMLSSITDPGLTVMRFGMTRTAVATARFLTNLNLNRSTRAFAKKIGTAAEWELNSRGRTLGEISDDLAGSSLEHASGPVQRAAIRAEILGQQSSRWFTRLTLMATWNSAWKSIATILAQDELLRAAKGELKGYGKAQFAALGLGDDVMERVRGQIAKYGGEEDGVFRARTDLWDDKEAADKVETAIVAVVNHRAAFNRGQGDLPFLMDNEAAKTLFQIKSFAIASVNRLLIPAAQGLAAKDIATLNGVLLSIALGALVYVSKELVAGREPDLSPDRLALEAANWSGLLAFVPDMWDPVAGAFHLRRFSRYKDRSGIETALGPTYGTLTDLYGTVSGITDGEFTQKDVHKIRKLIYLQNVFYLRRLLNAIEGEVGEQFNLEGATTKPFSERLTELNEDTK